MATHGRSFWVLDDITSLEQYEDSVPQQEAHLFTPAVASQRCFMVLAPAEMLERIRRRGR